MKLLQVILALVSKKGKEKEEGVVFQMLDGNERVYNRFRYGGVVTKVGAQEEENNKNRAVFTFFTFWSPKAARSAWSDLVPASNPSLDILVRPSSSLAFWACLQTVQPLSCPCHCVRKRCSEPNPLPPHCLYRLSALAASHTIISKGGGV